MAATFPPPLNFMWKFFPPCWSSRAAAVVGCFSPTTLASWSVQILSNPALAHICCLGIYHGVSLSRLRWYSFFAVKGVRTILIYLLLFPSYYKVSPPSGLKTNGQYKFQTNCTFGNMLLSCLQPTIFLLQQSIFSRPPFAFHLRQPFSCFRYVFSHVSNLFFHVRFLFSRFRHLFFPFRNLFSHFSFLRYSFRQVLSRIRHVKIQFIKQECASCKPGYAFLPN